MLRFKRYPYIADLLEHYIAQQKRSDIDSIYKTGIKNDKDAEVFCKFILDIVESIHSDSEAERTVLGSIDNTDMLPDMAYEISAQMKHAGYFYIWEKTLDHQK